jgi:hypothetical protein
MKLPPSHQDSPRHTEWLARVNQLESEGLDTSDAQGIADMEAEQTNKQKINMNKENAVLELVKLLSESIDVLNDYDQEQCADYLSKEMQNILDSIKK